MVARFSPAAEDRASTQGAERLHRRFCGPGALAQVAEDLQGYMSESSDEPRVFGFTRSDWVRSGAFTDEHFERILGSIALGERVSFTAEAWLALARLGPDYARAVWDAFGQHWLASLQRLREDVVVTPRPAVGDPERFKRPRRYLAEKIREVRRLAGLDELELSD
jgi:hypothetical protein